MEDWEDLMPLDQIIWNNPDEDEDWCLRQIEKALYPDKVKEKVLRRFIRSVKTKMHKGVETAVAV